MVQFTRLRLSGFKSFVEPVEFEIGKGLTGIVGPNGCGKSNLVEALRWVMGENSPKRMRSGGMEDVIFSGTERRPARNTAEVTLNLDNADRTAPAEINDSDELEVSRKIERDAGSTYKVNGKNVRMRDVQLLFADSSIGAHSPALVSQGRVADMINAKPAQRRMVLEEAAGISGLHARRHEAELKLRAAETNLSRVEDVVGAMNAQLESLKKQARQANRYRNLSGHIETAEASLLYARFLKGGTAVEQARAAFDAAEEIVREKTLAATELTTRQTEAAATLPQLRQEEAQAAAALQRLKLAYGSLESEERQVTEERGKAETLLAQFTADVDHETAQKAEAETQIEALNTERATLVAETENQSVREEAAAQVRDAQQEIVTTAETALATLTEEVAGIEAQRGSAGRRIADLEGRAQKLEQRKASLETMRAEISAALPAQEDCDALASKVAAAETVYADANAALDAAEAGRAEAETRVQDTQTTLQDAERAYAELAAEAGALRRLLESPQESFTPVLENVTAATGFEKALAAALGEDLQAALDEAAPMYWRAIDDGAPAPALPTGAVPLSEHVQGPHALSRAIAHIGVVASAEEAARLMPALQPGQCLVTAEGGAWRWDGLVVTASAESAAAARLRQKNRLAEVEAQIPGAESTRDAARDAATQAKDARAGIAEAANAARQAQRTAENELTTLRREHAAIENRIAQGAAKLEGIVSSIETATQEAADTSTQLEDARDTLAALPATDEGRARIEADRETLAEQRRLLAEQQAAYAETRREGEARARRIAQVETDTQGWQGRAAKAVERMDELAARIAQAEDVLTRLAGRPAEIEREKQDLMSRISNADSTRQGAADALAVAENTANELARELRAVETSLSDAKETRALSQGRVETAMQAQSTVVSTIDEKFSLTPDALIAKFELNAESLGEIEDLQSRFDRLVRERENMGPVNLLAEAEAQEITGKMDEMTAERDDLVAAIDKLREGISKLNKEARARLLAAFDAVNAHFQTLFTRLFSGGAAHLRLIDADDPLEAGLEIFAQPPGKKMQSLSLLSGGEQTLTSIALIFGMFLTNPAPICVLDEVDAPLDESNVDRYCTLLEELSRSGETRFIVVTHHRMTMARMDRLYGVTMSEKGVSQLVSVDLSQHEFELDQAA